MGVSGAHAQDLSQNQTEAAFLQEFTELTGVSVTSNQIVVDRLIGTNMNIGDTITPPTNYSGTGVFLPSGSYDSHIFHLDGVGTGGAIVVTGTLTLDEEIVALIYSNSGSATLLNASDAIFGNATAYSTAGSRRLETNDTITLIDAFTIEYSFRAGNNFIDNLRVLTTPPQANITSSKTVSVHSSSPTDCDVIPGTVSALPPAAVPGSCMEYIINLENIGTGDASAFSVEDVLPPELIFQAAEFSGFISTDPSYVEIEPPIGSDCGVVTCTVRVEGAGLVAGGTAEIIVRSLIR
jgi:uncharacterized repeat protein (TIGR01451 family)